MVDRATSAGESSKTLDRGIRLLELLLTPDAAAGLTITQLAAGLEVGRPVVYRLVATLEQHRLVVRRDGGRVRLGFGLTRLAAGVTPVIQTEALPVLRRLADACGATAHLTVADGDQALALVVVEPTWTDVHVAYRSGARHPLTQGAAGRAILAGRAGRFEVVATDGELQSGAHGLACPLQPSTPAAPTLDASVGVVSFEPLAPEVSPRLLAAARTLGELLR
ncbi:IclR family transcriptional regulator [Humibacillus sp. DSM 29435]|uniref:IclR family transcriptional regulator n=1 Tax=Humibacillus sp. DSM 29435 TaxID=1869167 RepID=UPI000871DB2B|nr:helix-turn-helix domain-containing protein [Humibacillus sp. DSM 29435]OFE17983.1 IclR family transcriptional regulator [Humibacillus sp. DSM 29435]